MTTFYCKEAPELKLGPHDEVIFHEGFGEVALDDPDREAKLGWIEAERRAYAIENLGEETEAPECRTCGLPRPLRLGRAPIRPVQVDGRWNPPARTCGCR